MNSNIFILNFCLLYKQMYFLLKISKTYLQSEQQQRNNSFCNFYSISIKMNSIMNHNRQGDTPTSPHGSLRAEITTPSQIIYSKGIQSQTNSTKHSMQILYKNQLDSLMQQKQKQKRHQKQSLERQKQQYRQLVRIGQTNQKMKDLAYKNYYKMLMQSQDQNSETYVSPYEQRDKLKESHIQNSIDQEVRKSQNYDYEKRFRELEKKNQYRDQLMKQMDDRKKQDQMNKSSVQQQNIFFRQHTKVPQEIENYERQRKKEEMNMYRHDLDKIISDKSVQNRKSMQLNSKTQARIQYGDDFHNPLINPLPYNIQNPYILRQMQKISPPSNAHLRNDNPHVRNDNPHLRNDNPHTRNDSHLFEHQNKYQFQQRPRNQSSYFVRQGNNLLR